MSDQTCDAKFTIESVDLLKRLCYEGSLSPEDVEVLQSNKVSINYSIKNDAEIVFRFFQSYEIIELLTKMTALYNISLMYSNHVMKFNHCKFNSMKSVISDNDILVEAKFICEAKPGLSVEFEHTKIGD